ncbi:hypothetical protein [Pseudomonas putida]|uniref:hypothetical protein n=1 Tax=Pseudomonas putida TaxID=303 RepID=UPI002DBA5F4B|nr:hypothetical protein [Pseudomonas putida]WRW01741.1 hypothetical protein VPZ82_18615 [Pseudomonas putida]
MTTAELEKVHAEIVKLMADTSKINAEACNVSSQAFWYPVAVASSLVTMVTTTTALLIKVVS